jgi:hypothetical protein
VAQSGDGGPLSKMVVQSKVKALSAMAVRPAKTVRVEVAISVLLAENRKKRNNCNRQ